MGQAVSTFIQVKPIGIGSEAALGACSSLIKKWGGEWERNEFTS
jgi:phage-related protein